MWATRVLGFKHFHMPNLKAWMSRTAKSVMEEKIGWETRTKWGQKALEELKFVVSFVVENAPASVLRPEPDWQEQLWSDACPSGGGYLLEQHELSGSWPWEAYWAADSIHVLEAEALRRALKRWLEVRGETEGVQIKNDNAQSGQFFGCSSADPWDATSNETGETQCPVVLRKQDENVKTVALLTQLRAKQIQIDIGRSQNDAA